MPVEYRDGWLRVKRFRWRVAAGRSPIASDGNPAGACFARFPPAIGARVPAGFAELPALAEPGSTIA
jgi:hypothetical protein